MDIKTIAGQMDVSESLLKDFVPPIWELLSRPTDYEALTRMQIAACAKLANGLVPLHDVGDEQICYERKPDAEAICWPGATIWTTEELWRRYLAARDELSGVLAEIDG